MIDIGGPTMVRAAAKNCDSVAIVTDPAQYTQVLEEMDANNGALTKATRRRLARDAFYSTARYARRWTSRTAHPPGPLGLPVRAYSSALVRIPPSPRLASPHVPSSPASPP